MVFFRLVPRFSIPRKTLWVFDSSLGEPEMIWPLRRLGPHNPKALLKTLQQLSKKRTEVQVEVEGTYTRFTSTLILKNEFVGLSFPMGKEAPIAKGTWLRMKLPPHHEREMRMEVVNPHFLVLGNRFILCKRPDNIVEQVIRRSQRYNTAKYANLSFAIPSIPVRHRIIDLSTDGCKIYAPPGNAQKHYVVNQPLDDALIQVGKRMQIKLQAVVPRVVRDNYVGLEFVLEETPEATRYITYFLNWLERSAAAPKSARSVLSELGG